LCGNQVTAQNKEEIDPDPAEPLPVPRQDEPEKPGVIDDRENDCHGSQEIQAGLLVRRGTGINRDRRVVHRNFLGKMHRVTTRIRLIGEFLSKNPKCLVSNASVYLLVSAFRKQRMNQFSLRSPRAFIFDLDGTLVDSNELHVDSWDRAFRHFGKQFSREELRAQIGKGSDQYLPEFLTEAEIESFGKKLDEYRSHLFKKEYLPRVRPFPKVRELFQRLRDDGKRIVLATSGKESETKYYIKLLKVEDLIDGSTSADDADQSKPAPDIFEAALGKLARLSANEAIVVGDTRFDIEAASKAGLNTIALLCGGTDERVLRCAGALMIYQDPADLLVSYEESSGRSA
jgi:HAD superfamily hydrolase (TIGR01549 family)